MSETQAPVDTTNFPETEGQPLPNKPDAAPIAEPQKPGLLTRIFGEGGSLYTPTGVATATTVGVVAGIVGTLLVQAVFGGGEG